MIYKVSQEFSYPPFELGLISELRGLHPTKGFFPSIFPYEQTLDPQVGSTPGIDGSKIGSKISPGRKIQYNVIQRQFFLAMKKNSLWLSTWWFQTIFYVQPYLGGKWSNLTSIFFKRVVQPPTSCFLRFGIRVVRFCFEDQEKPCVCVCFFSGIKNYIVIWWLYGDFKEHIFKIPFQSY